MSRISYYNHEGYRDPTAYAALNSAEKAFQKKQHEVRCSVYKNNPYRPLVFICSPFAGDIKRNVAAARQYCRFAVSKGNIPFAPHLLFPQFLNDGNLYDRETGMVMGLAMLTKCAEVWVFGDNHTPGMRREIKKAKLKHIPIRYFDTDCQEVTA